MVVSSAWENSSKTWSSLSGGIPIPESDKENQISFAPPVEPGRTASAISPWWVNLAALLSRLKSACRTLVTSARISPSEASTSTVSRLSFFWTSASIVATTSSTIERMAGHYQTLLAGSVLGWRPSVQLEEGLVATAAYFRDVLG